MKTVGIYWGYLYLCGKEGEKRFIFSLHIRFIEALCLTCCREPEKFKTKYTRISVTVLTHMRGAVVPYLYTLGFLRTFDKDVGICSSTLCVFINLSFRNWEGKKQINYGSNGDICQRFYGSLHFR